MAVLMLRLAASEDVPEAEEVPDFLLGGLVADALDVDGVASGRHDCCEFEGVLVYEGVVAEL